jgi:hypothetical protein
MVYGQYGLRRFWSERQLVIFLLDKSCVKELDFQDNPDRAAPTKSSSSTR